ncbi:MAG: LysE family transporter [Candidatus Babeliales bacterium]
MDGSFWIQGFVIGFTVATSIGISGALCLQNMMTGRAWVAMASALAAAMADATCAVLVVLGLQAGHSLLSDHSIMLKVVAGLFLCFLGIKRLFSKISLHAHHGKSSDVIEAFFSVFFLALVDPVSIIDFMALSVGLVVDFSIMKDAVSFVVGLFLGSATWWFSWCLVLVVLRKDFSLSVLQWFARASSAGIFGFGLWTLSSVFRA